MKSIKANEIRPKKFEKEKIKALSKDLDFLYSNIDKFVEVSCPACDNDNSIFIFEKYKFKFYKCNYCRTVYMKKRATKELLNKFYQNSNLYNFWNEYIFPESEKARKNKIFKPRLKTIIKICKKYGIKTESFLEIGAGYCYLCEMLQDDKIFKNIVAVEPNRKLAKSCKDKNIFTVNENFESIEFNHKFDVVASFETIEHMFDPFNTLQKINSIMKKNGLFYLSCPNFEGFDILTLLEKSDNIDAEHINMFNPDSIKLLLQRSGFNVVSITTPGKLDVDIVKEKLVAGEIKDIFLEKLLLNQKQKAINEFQKYLQKYNLSSHMQILALKR